MFSCPLFEPLRPWLETSPPVPDTAFLAAQAAEANLQTRRGRPLTFVPPQDDGLGYEERIWRRGEVETRPGNWHDFFNALVWLAFPKAKAELNARHWREIEAAAACPGGGRGTVRDAMTHFDECGLVVLSSDPALIELLRNFAWKRLFWARRGEVREKMAFVVFGHATYEQLFSPFRGLTAKAVLYPVEADFLAADPQARRTAIDQRLAADLAAGRHARSADLQPVPLLGVPGVTPDSECAAYYDDAWQFRPGRRRLVR